MTKNELDRAKLNRKIVKEKLYVEAYVKVENFLEGYSVNKKLPDWIPQDKPRDIIEKSGR